MPLLFLRRGWMILFLIQFFSGLPLNATLYLGETEVHLEVVFAFLSKQLSLQSPAQLLTPQSNAVQ